MGGSRLLRARRLALAGGFLAVALVVVLLRWLRGSAASYPAIVLAEGAS